MIMSDHRELIAGPVFTKRNLFVAGYDLVSYWSGKPRKGKKVYSQVFGESEIRFVSRDSKREFLDKPIN